MNYEGWSNKVGLGRSSNRWEDGSHIGMAVLVSGHLGLQQLTGIGIGLRDGSHVKVAWAVR